MILKAAYKKSGLTVADLAAATGLSVGTIHIALAGLRYRSDGLHVAVPSDATIVKLSAVLGIDPLEWVAVDRKRAADLLEEALAAGARQAVPHEQAIIADSAARTALAIRVLEVFSADELRAELRRRKEPLE